MSDSRSNLVGSMGVIVVIEARRCQLSGGRHTLLQCCVRPLRLRCLYGENKVSQAFHNYALVQCRRVREQASRSSCT